MFSFFRKKNNQKIQVPEWAAFFTDDEYNTFIIAVDQYLKRSNVEFEIGDGIVHVTANDFGFSQLGLTNVAQYCKQQKLKYYNQVVTDHFDSMKRGSEFNGKFNAIVHDFENVKQYVGVRLYDKEYVAHVGKEFTLGKNFGSDIYAMLVFDLPDSVINIKPEQIQHWNKNFEELFEFGIKSIKEKYPLSITQEQFGEFNIWFVQADHFFVPNIVFDLENKKELLGSKGALIGLPHRHAAIIYPIENLEVITAINTLIPTIYGMNQEGPGSLSNNLFWYSNGEFINLPYKLEKEKLQFIPPEKFLDMLNTLKPKDDPGI